MVDAGGSLVMADVDAGNAWESAETARSYADFARRYTTYRETSRDLVALADPDPDARAVDLACGSGVTTEALLSVLGPSGRVLAVDASAAMLAAAKSAVRDSRVRWLRLRAERLESCVSVPADVVVCNSALWQTDVLATVTAVAGALRPGGRFAFNLPPGFLTDHDERRDRDESLVELMAEFAAANYGWEPSPGADRPDLSEGWLRRVLGEAGMRVEQVRLLTYRCSLEEERAWLSMPIFTERAFGSLSHGQRMAALDHACRQRSDSQGDPEPVTSTWVAFATRREPP
jgi:SAM-dependent methyltransferase